MDNRAELTPGTSGQVLSERGLRAPVAEELETPRHHFRLLRPWVYYWQAGGCWRRLRVPAGFVYGASVPWYLWWLTPPGPMAAGACGHDWPYHHAGYMPRGSYMVEDIDGHWREEVRPWLRRDCDRLFARILRETKVSKRSRRFAFRGVRAFGWAAWRRNARDRAVGVPV